MENSKDIAYAKQGALASTNWDTFQQVIRRCLHLNEGAAGKRGKIVGRIVVIFAILLGGVQAQLGQAEAMTRTIKSEPALVIVAFGTTTKAQVTYDFFGEQLVRELPAKFQGYKIAWAFTSEIVRERANKKFQETGQAKRFLSLAQTLSNLEDEGYRKIVLQSLHVFPGQEYEDMQKEIEAFRSLGLRIEYGGSLMHKWEWAFEALGELEKEFLSPDQGSNILVVHGSPETFPGSNSTYLGLDRYVSRKYTNVAVGGVDGVLTREQAIDQAKAFPVKRVRLIPFMYVAGDHIMNDIMGVKADEHGVPSWAMELEAAGIQTETLHTSYQGSDYFMGLGFNEGINRILIRQLVSNLKKMVP